VELAEQLLRDSRATPIGAPIRPLKCIYVCIMSYPIAASNRPEGTLAFTEQRLGYDFSQVRIHTDNNATETAKNLNAQAFTFGQDIAFGEGQYTLLSAPI